MNIIKVYGSGCANCKTLEALTKEAVSDLGIDCEIQKVEDVQQIVASGLMRTPGLEINGKMVSSGKIPAKSSIITWIEENKN